MIYEYVQRAPTHVFISLSKQTYAVSRAVSDVVQAHFARMPTTNARHAALGVGRRGMQPRRQRLLMQQHTQKYQNDIPTSIWLVEPKHNIPKPSHSYTCIASTKRPKNTSTPILDEPTQKHTRRFVHNQLRVLQAL